SPQMWQDFLISIEAGEVATTCSDTFAVTHKRAALQVFGEDMVVKSQGWKPGDIISWHGMDILVDSLANPPMLLTKWILWELYELNFCYELYALDCIMATELWVSSFTERCALLHSIFPGDSSSLMWDDCLLKQDSNLGLCVSPCSHIFQERWLARPDNFTMHTEGLSWARKMYIQWWSKCGQAWQ
ncbi:hypothetical protein PAXRUDRAFT_170901, partial [Paxillus rubicundulus Ve08.2h10]